MVASTSFVMFGVLGGFSYLAYMKKRELLCYGLGALGTAFFLEGVRLLVGPSGGVPTFLDILHHVALGVGAALLAYVGAVEGWKLYQIWKEKRHEAELAFQAKLQATKVQPANEPERESASGRIPGPKRVGTT